MYPLGTAGMGDLSRYEFDPHQAFSFHDPSRIEYWVMVTIKDQSDLVSYGVSEYWAPPDQTYARMAGDCDDKALLFAYFCHRYLGLQPELVDGQVLDPATGAVTGHMAARIGSEYFMLGTFQWVGETRTFTYGQAIWAAVDYYAKEGL